MAKARPCGSIPRHESPKAASLRRGALASLLLALLLLLVLVTARCVAASPDSAQETVEGGSGVIPERDSATPDPVVADATADSPEGANPYAYLDRFDLAELKKYAFDTYPGKIDEARYTDRVALLRAVIRLEKEAEKVAELKQRVMRFVETASEQAVSQPYTVVIEACEQSQLVSKAKKMIDQDVYLGLPEGLHVNVTVAPYAPPPYRRVLSHVLKTAFFAIIATALSGGQFMPPTVMRFVEQRKGIVFSTGLICNMLSSSLLLTGAFEVYVEGKLVYSKLETGRIPEGGELSEIILENTVLSPEPTAIRKRKRGQR